MYYIGGRNTLLYSGDLKVCDALYEYINKEQQGGDCVRQQRLLVKIHAAAFYFSQISRDVHKIAEMFGVSKDAIYKWAKTPEWDYALSVFNYTGDREFLRRVNRDTARDAGDVFDKARSAYFKAIAEGVPERKLATVAGAVVGLPRRRIHAWAKQYGWREIANRDRHVAMNTEASQ